MNDDLPVYSKYFLVDLNANMFIVLKQYADHRFTKPAKYGEQSSLAVDSRIRDI